MPALILKQIKTPLELVDRQPLRPGPDEVVVHLKVASLNRRDDWINAN